jgi:tetrapyrrole methylase family protein / MazG family protein
LFQLNILEGTLMTGSKFTEFVAIVKRLRKECPWDREQTNDSIKANTIEEAYEVIEAIDNKNFDELKKELGDLLLHVIFHTQIAEEENYFTIDDVIDSIQEKLIRRHPHVFGEVEVTNSQQVKKNWEEIKLSEGRDSVLDGVPFHLPALQRAHRLQEKAAKVGFDWDKKEDVWKKVIEEIEEMHNSEREETEEKLEKEVGDVFFAMVNYARFLGINPEDALRLTNKKFIKRFNYVQQKVKETGKAIYESNLEEMDKYWNESKKLNGYD